MALLLRRDLKKEAKEKLLEDLKKFLGSVKNEKIDSLGEKKLAYPVKRERSGEYVVLSFESDSVAQDFSKRVGIREEVLRHLLIRN